MEYLVPMNEFNTHPKIQDATIPELKRGNLPSGTKYFCRIRPSGSYMLANAMVQNILPTRISSIFAFP
jgi:hypothetical protein